MKSLYFAILKLCTTNQLFKYFRRRYNDQQIKIFNKLVRTRGKLRNLQSLTVFLKICIAQRVAPKSIYARIEKARVKHSPTMERAFMKDDIRKQVLLAANLKNYYRSLWSDIKSFLSFFDFIRYCRYVSIIDRSKAKETQNKHERNLSFLRRRRFGNQSIPDKSHLINLSDYQLSDTEEFVLLHGLNFCLPPTSVQREEVFAEFEVLFGQLIHHKPQSDERLSALKARLSDLAHAYCDTPVDVGDFLMNKESLQAIKSLHSNQDILITKPDEGSGVVIMNKKDYVSKMESILNHQSKFCRLRPAPDNDNTVKIESKIRRLLQMHKDDLLPTGVYEVIRPTGSQRPRMYGLPKIHKKDVPFRPILSMTGSAQHQLATWLTSVLQPVLSLYSSYCIQDSFSFVDAIRSSNLQPASTFMCSFDISSLFTNVPLAETIQICADSLYNFLPTPTTFPRNVFVELMELATCSVDFSFNNIMHRQIDGVAMGSPLGPCLANIFVGFYESKLFQTIYVLPLR